MIFEEMFINNLNEENKKLKQQLAEKEKELAYMTKQAKKFNNEAQKYYEDAYCNDFHKQDKISFAVEQLEKVKEWCEHWKCYTENINYVIVEEKNGIRCNPTLYEEIDNQIKALKEGK